MKTPRELVPSAHAWGCRAPSRTFAAGGLSVAAVLILLLTVAVPPALAVHLSGSFELDGDAVNSGAAGDDWDNAIAAPPTGADAVFATAETPNKSFVIGTKDLDDISGASVTSTVWRWDLHSVPDKDHLTNAYAIRYPNGNLYFGADRFANNGDAMIGFWFFQNAVSLNPDGTFRGVHKTGDLLILSNFVNGGRTSEIRVYMWDPAHCTPNDGCPTLKLLVAGLSSTTSIVCDPSDTACAVTNPVDAAAPWAYTPKFGATGTFPPVSFFEGGVNLAALGLAGECFASFLAETRSSQSVTASSKDFILSGFEPCNPAIAVTKQCTAAVNTGGTGVNVSFSGTVCNTGSDDLIGVSVSNDKGGVTQQPSSTLAIGACSPYSGSYTSSTLDNTDTVTATGSGARNSGTVTSTATASCSAGSSKGISVNKTCDTDLQIVQLATGSFAVAVSVHFGGQVCNTGNVQLTGVSVSNDKGGTISGPSATLAPGECSLYSGDYTPTNISAGNLFEPNTALFTDRVTATGTAALGLGGVSSNSGDVTCPLCPAP